MKEYLQIKLQNFIEHLQKKGYREPFSELN